MESCPHHQILDHLLIQYFYEGLTEANRSLVDAASGGALYDKTPTEARKLIKTMAFNTQQFGSRNDNPPQGVNKLIVGNTQQVKACGICTSTGHSTDACPTLHEEPTMYVNTIGEFSGPSQRGYVSKTYNPGWRDHPNLRYDYQSQNFQKPLPPPQSNPNSGKLPSQTIINPEQNVSAITMCSEKELQFENSTRCGHARQNRTENSVVCGHAEQGKIGEEFEISPKEAENSNQVGEEHPKVFVPKPPFPERFAKSKKEEEEKKILEALRKVEVNIPLLEAIKQVPRYAKFLKEMCINKFKLRGNERVNVGENVSTILQSKLPPKCKDPGTFSIYCQIGNIGIKNAMCDLGASINVMPLAIYESLNIGPLKETGVVLQLADRSIVYPDGVLEDVLVQINELVFPADFYVLDMMGDNSPNSASILLGRPFLKTSKTKIDVDARILSIEFDNEVVSFSIGGVTHNSNDMHSIFLMDFIDHSVQGHAMFDGGEYSR
ncbi:UNVERIFIED_CONTAM: hypothetical protein Sradi_3918400, partial [Sesamum radiatum]